MVASPAVSLSPAECPVCFVPSTRFWGKRTSLPMYECAVCGVIFFDRRTIQGSNYGHYYDYTTDWDAERVSWELKIRTAKFRRQLKRLGGYAKGRALLDIGAGPGYYCRVARDEGWDASAVEISPSAAAIGEKYLAVRYVRLEDVPAGSLNVITCHHVVEHIDWPLSFLGVLRQKLAPGGVIAAHVPHRECLSFWIRNKLGLSAHGSDKLCTLYAPEHLTGFTRESLAALFRRAGFAPLLLRTASMWSSYYDPFFFKNYTRRGDYIGIVKHALRCTADNFGILFGRGEWVIGHFRKLEDPVSITK